MSVAENLSADAAARAFQRFGEVVGLDMRLFLQKEVESLSSRILRVFRVCITGKAAKARVKSS